MADELPTELIERIFQFAAATDRATGLAICLTNKLGRRAAQQAMYQNITLPGWSGDYKDGLVDQRMQSWSLLCRTLLENRRLAQHVRGITAYLDDLDNVTYKLPEPIDHDLVFKLIDETYSGPVRHRVTRWMELQHGKALWIEDHEIDEEDEQDEEDEDDFLVYAGSPRQPMYGPGVCLSIVMLAAPNVNYMELNGDQQQLIDMYTLSQAIRGRLENDERPVDGWLDGIGNTQEVFYNNEDEDVNSDRLVFISRWPSLIRMTIGRLTEGGIFPYMDNVTKSAFPKSTLQELQILDVIPSEEDIAAVLFPCPQLKTLSLAYNEGVDVYRNVDWRLLGRTLQDRNPLLKDLRLDIAHREDVRQVFIDTVPNNWNEISAGEQERFMAVNSEGIGSLQELKHLRKLAAPKIGLFGVFDDPEERDREWTLDQILPSSLEELQIFCEGWDFTEEDKALLEAPGTSKLREITIYNATRSRWISRNAWRGIDSNL